MLESQVQEGIVNAGEVAATVGLSTLAVKAKGVDVDVLLRNASVHLVGQHSSEVLALAGLEAGVTVQLEVDLDHGVLTVATLIVEEDLGIAVALLLNSPDQLLHRVVEVQLDAGSGLAVSADRGNGTSGLHLSDQVLVRALGKAGTLLTIKVDVVDVEGGAEITIANSAALTADQRGGIGIAAADPQLGEGAGLDLNLDIVVLKRVS